MAKKPTITVNADYVYTMQYAMSMILQGKGKETNQISGDLWETTLSKMINGLEENLK